MSDGAERVIGRYLLGGELASGGMATVHIGRLEAELGFSRVVAIKHLHPQYARDPDFVSMLLDEARLTCRIRHANVVPVLDVVIDESELFLVMEYVAGESLASLLRGVPRVPVNIAVALAIGILEGLEAAHRASDEDGQPLCIVHRDVSPQNVLVGVDGLPRLLDFGIAKAVGRTQTTRNNELKGKLAYMAPEQLARAEVDARADVFAASIVLWEMLTGRRLFATGDEVSTCVRVATLEIPAAGTLVSLPAGLDAVLMQGLSREVATRWRRARDAHAQPRPPADRVVRRGARPARQHHGRAGERSPPGANRPARRGRRGPHPHRRRAGGRGDRSASPPRQARRRALRGGAHLRRAVAGHAARAARHPGHAARGSHAGRPRARAAPRADRHARGADPGHHLAGRAARQARGAARPRQEPPHGQAARSAQPRQRRLRRALRARPDRRAHSQAPLPLMGGPVRTILLALLCLVTLGGRAHAEAPSVQDQCAEAYEQTQRARNAGRLREARQHAVQCGQDACSPILRGDCVGWARELAASIPSVIFDVRHADGSAPHALEASIDGKPVPRDELGRAVTLDPGAHVFELRDGTARVRVTLTVVEGAQRQSVHARFPAQMPVAVASETSRRQRTGQALLAVGAAGLAGFAGLAGAGYARERALDADCAPHCARARAEPIERLYLAADISLGVGVAAAAVGLWVWLRDPARRERAAVPAVSLAAAPGAAALSWSTRF
jgi:hypothetical protein